MATRSTIAICNKNDKLVDKIYCHWDGYLEWNGAILQKYYNTADKVRKLLSLGNLSSLGPKIKPDDPGDWDISANRDRQYCLTYTSRGEEWANCRPDDMEEYNYLFDEEDACWIVTREVCKKPGRVADEMEMPRLWAQQTEYLIDALSELPEHYWEQIAPQDENDWGITLEEVIAAAREARLPIIEQKRRERESYERAYFD